MIKLNDFEINAENVTKIVSRFRNNDLIRLRKLGDYYNLKNKILSENIEGAKRNKIAHNYARFIVTIQVGYFMGIDVKQTADKENEDYLKLYEDILDDNFSQDINYELAKSASIYGLGAEIIYQNERAETRFKKLDVESVIPIFSSSIDEFLIACIRIYQSSDLDNNLIETAEVYDAGKIYVFEKKKNENKYRFIEEKNHGFSEIPFVLYKNNEEMTSDFEHIITINDMYDKAQSNTANDSDYFQDAYLMISGANELADTESSDEDDEAERTRNKMQKSKVFYFPEGGEAKFLVKDVNDSALENYKNRLNSDIHKISMTPDLADEQFAGNLSGIAIKFKTIPLEQSAMQKENKFRVGFRKRREIITSVLNKIKGKNFDFKVIREEFTRNLPQNEQEKTLTILSLANHISKKTLLELLPQIDDVDAELKRLDSEKEELTEYEGRDHLALETPQEE